MCKALLGTPYREKDKWLIAVQKGQLVNRQKRRFSAKLLLKLLGDDTITIVKLVVLLFFLIIACCDLYTMISSTLYCELPAGIEISQGDLVSLFSCLYASFETTAGKQRVARLGFRSSSQGK